jgi:hypothetical protein
MDIAFVHHFHAETDTVEHVGPGVGQPTLIIKNGLVEVEAVQVEGDGADDQDSYPDADNRPSNQEKSRL